MLSASQETIDPTVSLTEEAELLPSSAELTSPDDTLKSESPKSPVKASATISVFVEKSAGAELGLSYVERSGALEVAGCKAALLDAIVAGRQQVVAGDRLVEVNG